MQVLNTAGVSPQKVPQQVQLPYKCLIELLWSVHTFWDGWKRGLGLQLHGLPRGRARPGVMLRLLRCARCVLFRRLAQGLRESLPVLLLLALTLRQRALLCLVPRAAALLRLVWPSQMGPV